MDIIELLFEKTTGIKPTSYMKQGIFKQPEHVLQIHLYKGQRLSGTLKYLAP
jgi:hypothetical protein